jgi:Family of unknown function (DUF6101)
LRRQLHGGETGSGSSGIRLDPFALPIRFTAIDAAADERLRVVELCRERVVVRRSVRGIRMAVNVPVASFRGVALRLWRPDGDSHEPILISLEHRDPALCVPLLAAPEGADVISDWQLWARILGLPALLAEADGTLGEPFRRLGAVRLGTPTPRRRRHTPIKERRPVMPLRRRCGLGHGEPKVHRGEREIIARN